MNDNTSDQPIAQGEHPLAKKVRITSLIHYALYAALLGLILLWNTQRDDGFKIGIFLFQALPLLAFLPGMLKGAYRTYSWLCFILLFYFIFAVQSVFSTIRSGSDFVFLGLIVLVFITSMMMSRWQQRLQKGVV